jgi:hypothetical protein
VTTLDGAGSVAPPPAAVWRVRAVMGALADPAPELLACVLGVGALVDREPSLRFLDADPFAVVIGRREPTEATSPHRPDLRPRRHDPAARSSDASSGADGRASTATGSATPIGASTTDRPGSEGATPTASPGPGPSATARGAAGPPEAAGAGLGVDVGGATRPTRSQDQGFAELATRLLDALLGRPHRSPSNGARPQPRAGTEHVDGAAAARIDRPGPSPSPPGRVLDPGRVPVPAGPRGPVGRSGRGATTGPDGHGPVTSEGPPHAPDVAASTDPVVHGGEGPDQRRGFALQRRGGTAADAAAPSRSPGRTGESSPWPPGSARGGSVAEVDAEEIAALINEVLADQARRHGVDLS